MSAKTHPYPSESLNNNNYNNVSTQEQEIYYYDDVGAEQYPPHPTEATTTATPVSHQSATVIPPSSSSATAGAAVVSSSNYIRIDSRKPVTLTYCPRCAEHNVTTYTRTKSNGSTALCVVLGVVIFWPLCWLPLCIKPMKQTNHYCKACGAKVGRVKPFQ